MSEKLDNKEKTQAVTPKQAQQPGAFATSLGKWIHRNKDTVDKNPVGYTFYQVVRSAAASVPYGISMAATWLGFEKLAVLGESIEGKAKSKFGKGFGQRLTQLTRTPAVRASAMIGTSFTLYRGTSKLGKWIKESLFNPNDTEEQTIQEVQNLPKNVWGKIKEVAPAEINSTPVAAVVLGFVVSAFNPKGFKGHKFDMDKARKAGEGWKYFNKVVWGKGSKFLEHAAINTVGYSLFFELGDRRFKDKQLSRGMWGGDAHSIGSSSKSNPSLLEKPKVK